MAAKILLCDDDPGIRQTLSLLLQKFYAVAAASDGPEALRLAQAAEPALVLLDVSMPGWDGLETLKRLRAAHPALPVIMLSAQSQLATVRRALALGARSYVTKPFDAETVLCEVALALGPHEPAGERPPWRVEVEGHGKGAPRA